MKISRFVEFIFKSAPRRLFLSSHFKLLHTMGIESTTKGGGRYSAPMIETIEIAAEKGFATSPGDVPNSDGISPLSYDDFYLSQDE